MSASPQPAAAFVHLVLFDGVCGFCDSAVQWLIERDPHGRLRFAPLQGELAAELRARHPEIPERLDTFVFVEARDGVERVSLRSRGVLAACALLDPAPRWLGWAWLVPRPLADLGYRLFARVRYRVFGRLDACKLPTPDERSRFLA